jgi:coenzyme F420-reducing hydrogenase beta subunit
MLVSSEKCTGCFACINACPKQCISTVMDSEGFWQPTIDKSRCINCNKCEAACPMMNAPTKSAKQEPTVYAAWSKDNDLLDKSSSGGMFGVFARYTIENKGVVFGAAYNDDLSVSHISAETSEELNKLHGSKYVQSFIGLTYQKAKEFLNQNRSVLFSGTPCQIAGLYQFLGKDYDNLCTCDIVCHGVPSPGVYEKYINYVQEKEGKKVVKFVMRSKRKGWNPIFTPQLAFSDGSERKLDDAYKDPYLNGFLFDLYLRKPCYTCKYAKTNRESDITLADFWGIGREIPFRHETKQGISLLIVNNEKGESLIEKCEGMFIFEERSLKEAVAGNSRLQSHTAANTLRENFYNDYSSISFEQLTNKYLKRDFSFKYKLINMVVKIVGLKNIKKIKVIIKGLIN